MDQEAHARLERALWADTAFLAGLGVMDYSLLVGVNRADSLLVVGIIDFIRQARLPIHSELSLMPHVTCIGYGWYRACVTGDDKL